MATRTIKRQRTEVAECIRKSQPQPKRGYIRNAIVSAATAQAVTVAKDLFYYQMDHGRLLTHLTAIPSPIGGAPLRIRARFRNDALNTLPPIVLIHGYGMGSSYLVPLGAQLAVNANIYIPELPGHGRSDHDFRPLKIPELAKALIAWMDQLGLRAAVLAGHSMGCQIAAEVAATRPDLASSLILIGPASDPAAPTSLELIGRTVKSGLFERKSLGVWMALDYSRAGRQVLKEEMKEILRHRLEFTLPNLDLPVRVIRGEKDSVAPQSWCEEVARLAKAGLPIVVPNCAHAVHYGEPKTVAQLILPFIKNLQKEADHNKTSTLVEEASKN